jgi:hypothetical protein
MQPEYNFDYGKAKPNRFAGKLDESRVMVVLDPDVSRIFQTPDSVNKALRALIEAMPPSGWKNNAEADKGGKNSASK